MNLPTSLLSKLGHYNIETDSGSVKVSIVDYSQLVTTYIKELSSLSKDKVVGIDAKLGEGYSLLVIYVDGRCLVIRLHVLHSYPKEMIDFLTDWNKCYFTIRLNDFHESFSKDSKKFSSEYDFAISNQTLKRNGVDLSDLAALVKQKPELRGAKLQELAKSVGLTGIPNSPVLTCLDSLVFSGEQVKSLIFDARLCYLIGKKLLLEIM